jgi:hypothetical protein
MIGYIPAYTGIESCTLELSTLLWYPKDMDIRCKNDRNEFHDHPNSNPTHKLHPGFVDVKHVIEQQHFLPRFCC